MQTISLCMIVGNEDKLLERCLKSVKDLVNEIVIVDTGSKDKTKEIAKKFTNKVYDFEWNNDFSEARNFSLKKATKDWILVLDADEVIAKEDHSKIKIAINSANAIGFSLIQRNYINKSHAARWVSSKDDKYAESKVTTGWYPTSIFRLFKNDKRIFYRGIVHESVDDSLIKIGKIIPLDVPIHHYGKLDINKLKEKDLLYEKIGEKKVEKNEDFYSYYELGRQYAANKKFDEAVHAFGKSIELKKDYFDSWYMLGSIYLIKEDLDNSLSKLKKAQSLNHNFAPIYVNLGVIYSKKKEFKKASKNFVKAIELNPKDATAYKNLGVCFDEMGDKEKAYSCFKKAIELNPKYKETIKLK